MPCRLTGRVSFPAELEAASRAASLLRSGWQYSLEATMHGRVCGREQRQPVMEPGLHCKEHVYLIRGGRRGGTRGKRLDLICSCPTLWEHPTVIWMDVMGFPPPSAV